MTKQIEQMIQLTEQERIGWKLLAEQRKNPMELLKGFLFAQNMRPLDVAEALGLKMSMLSHILSGRCPLPVERKEQLRALGVPDFFFSEQVNHSTN